MIGQFTIYLNFLQTVCVHLQPLASSAALNMALHFPVRICALFYLETSVIELYL